MSNSQQSINLENGSRGKNLQQVLIEKLMIVSKDDSGLLKLLQDIAHDPDGTSLSLHEKFYPIRLPRKIEDLVGRQVEQERITKYLLAHRSVIIYGQEGIGKTYLGNVVAHHVKDKKCFPGGIVWPCHEVGVDECSTEEVLDYIASSYGNTEILTKKDHKTALGKLSELLKEEEALIVLDLKLDDHSLQEIVQAIPYPCTLLLIHRTRVSGMIDVSLGALDHKSAVGLFMRLSEHPNQIGNSAFWKRRAISGGICFWRRYVPAAITAEATLASNYGKGLEKYWVKFLIELQEEQEAKNNSVFHQTLIKIERPIRSFLGKTETSFPGDSALILFWEELSDSCKRILTSLGEFRAGASEDALQTVSGLIGDDLKKNLEHLINIKIVQTSSPRYHLPPYIKRWIRAKKIPKDDPEVGSRVAKYFYRFTLQHQDQPDPDNIKALDLERANIKASLDWYRNTQSKDHLVNYIIALSQYWLVTYRWREYVYRLDDLLEFEQQIDDPIIKAWAHHQRGSIRLCQDDLDEAQKHLEIASSILRNENKENLNIRTGLTKTLHNFGVLYESQNNIENAARCYGESLSLHRPNDLPTAQYLESFLNQGPDNRNWGIEGIDLFDRERALHLRLQDLKDDSTQIRSHAVRGLQKYEDSRAIKGLVSVLQDTNEDIVCEAVTGLGKIGDQSVSPELSRLWSNSSNKVRLSLVDALGQLHHRWGDTATLTSLANGLNDPNPGVISKAVQILKTTSPRPEAAMTYITALGRPDEAGTLAEGFIRRLDTSALAPLKVAAYNPNPLIRSKVVRLISEISPDDFPAIARQIIALDPSPQLRQEVVGKLISLPEISNREKGSVLRIAALNDQDKDTRATAIKLAPELDESFSTALLDSVLAQEPDSSNRALALSTLGQVGNENAFSIIAGRGLNDTDFRVKELAVRVLQENQEQAVVPLSEVVLRRELPMPSRLEATKLLGNIRNHWAEDALIKASQLHEAPIQAVAFEQLGKIDTPASVNRIVTALSDESTYRYASHALSQIKGPDNLTKTLNRPDLDQSAFQNISSRLANFGSAAVPPLADNLRISQDYAIQLNNIRALSNIDDPAVASTLGLILQDPGKNPVVRREVVKHLEPWAHRNDQALDALLATHQDLDTNLRQVVDETIKRVTRNNLNRLESRLDDHTIDKPIRLEAARLIGQQGEKSQIRNLSGKIYLERDHDVKLEYIRAIGEIGFRGMSTPTANEAVGTLKKFTEGVTPVIRREVQHQISRIDRKFTLGNE